MYDPLVDLYDSEPLRATKELPAEKINALLASAHEAARQSTYPVSEALVASVFKRELPNGESSALREALRYISTVENYATKTPTKHTDLLPKGHPLNSDMLKSREDIASYFSQTFDDPEDRELVYAILASAKGSTQQTFLIHGVRPDQYAIIAAVEAAEKSVAFEDLDFEPPAEYLEELEMDMDRSYYELNEVTGERTEIKQGYSPYERMPYHGVYFFDPDPESSMENPDEDDQ
jgi:hypothetical protein